jgi:hypothetical protein
MFCQSISHRTREVEGSPLIVEGSDSLRQYTMGEAATAEEPAEAKEDIEMKTKSADASTRSKQKHLQQDSNRSLTQREILNLTFALLAWACTICNVTLGT